MELSDYLRDPVSAAHCSWWYHRWLIFISKLISTMRVNLNSTNTTNPLVLNAILVFFIVSSGLGKKEAISSDLSKLKD